MENLREYKVKDVELLLASKTIVGTLVLNLNELSIARSNWTEEYTTSLSNKIDSAIENYLGLDKKKELRDATAKLASIQVPALRELSFIKTQISVDFGKESKEYLKQLGFKQNLRDAQKGDQEALIQLLYSFKKGMSNNLKNKIIEKGTNPALIDRIISYADLLQGANVEQETLKETTKAISKEALSTFNEIYREVIGICKIAAGYYQYEPLKKEQFTFSKVVANMNAAKKINGSIV